MKYNRYGEKRCLLFQGPQPATYVWCKRDISERSYNEVSNQKNEERVFLCLHSEQTGLDINYWE